MLIGSAIGSELYISTSRVGSWSMDPPRTTPTSLQLSPTG